MTLLQTNEAQLGNVAELNAARLPVDAEILAAAIVAAHVRALFADANGECSMVEAFQTLRPPYRRWSLATLQYLEQQNRAQREPATQRYRLAAVESVDLLWKRWDAAKNTWQQNASHRAYLALIEACLRKLPEILTDAVPATDVMFPESSMHMVEGIYKHNTVADYFNQVLSDNLKSAFSAKIARGERSLRLLEIGAGTGGTTAALLPMLREFGDAIVEYCYTDLSKAFLLHADETYKPHFPAINTAIFDVSRPLNGQAVSPNRYDAVIATNVLHATPNMRETMRNAKAVLKRNGILLVNEISDWSWYTHFTFGLLEGWWLYEDEKLRLPGSPGLSPAQWEHLLKTERFFDIRFPALAQHDLGQQIIAATSDGVVRQRLVTPAKPQKASVRVSSPDVVNAATLATMPAKPATSDDSSLREQCTALFRDLISAALKMDAREIEPHKALEHYGLDSILVVQLTTRFRKLFPNVRSTLFFEVQSIDGLVQYFIANDRATLMDVLGIQADTQAVAATSLHRDSLISATIAPTGSERIERRRFAARKELTNSPALAGITTAGVVDVGSAIRPNVFDVAVIGISGRYPEARDLDEFWENLLSGRNCISEIPADRWNWEDYYDSEKGVAGKSYTMWGGFLTDIDKFDPLFFKIAPKEAKRIDPQERLFLETSYHAIEDSGYTPGTLAPNGKVGVFVGVMNSRYTVQPLYYSIANRVSFLFNFSGPSFAVDSACSSSLTAIHLALDSLYSGMCETAIAGGVSLIVDPQHMLELTAVGMLSDGAKCRSFGKNADGFVDAEGVGAVILKPLSHAERDRDNIHAVIKGSALNAGGRTHGYTVPNPIAQADVVSSALARANVDAADVSYIEAHGTGTALGDPIEVSGLTKAFNASSRARAGVSLQRQYCAIGSLKSNIGHCESAAGIAALSKVLLQFKHQQLVPTLHSEEVNDEIDFSSTPFRLQRELAPWRRPVVSDGAVAREIPRIAGISSFGAGGANAHLVVQEHQASKPDVTYRQWLDSQLSCIVPLSARTSEQLQNKIGQLHAFLSRQASSVNLKELAYTLQIGREAMDERLVLIADSIEDLQQQLQTLLADARVEQTMHRATVRQEKKFIAACKDDINFTQRFDAWIAQRDSAKIAEHWTKGLDFDWNKLYPELRPQRISLPLYPFARDRHWIVPQRQGVTALTPPATHPLLLRNTSTLRYPAFSASLKGDEPFLINVAAGQRILPSVLCIEMARAAVAAAYPEDIATQDMCFDDFVSAGAISVDASSELHIALLPDSDEVLRFEVFSGRSDQETVHSQGRVRFETHTQPTPVDVAAIAARLSRGNSADMFYDRVEALRLHSKAEHRAVQRVARSNRELVLELALSASAASEQWGLSPELLQCLTQGAAWLLSDMGQLPADIAEWQVRELRTLQLHARCDQRGYLVMRCIEHEGVNQEECDWEIECFDTFGKICFRGNGLRFDCFPDNAKANTETNIVSPSTLVLNEDQSATPTLAPALTSITSSASVVRVDSGVKKQIVFSPDMPLSPIAARFVAKPSAIALSAINRMSDRFISQRADRPAISLQEPSVAIAAASQPSSAIVHEYGNGVFSITIEHPALDVFVLDQLLQALQLVCERSDAKVLLILGSSIDFMHGDRQSLDHAIDSGLYRALLALPFPTIAVMQGNASGAGFMIGALCDFMVCSRQSRYAFSNRLAGIYPTTPESELLVARFGEAWANDLLYISGPQSGLSMSEKGWGFSIVEHDQALSTAMALANNMAAKSSNSLCLLKQHMARNWQAHVARLKTSDILDKDTDVIAERPHAVLSIEALSARDGLAIERLSDAAVSLRALDSGVSTQMLLRNMEAALDDLAKFSGYSTLILRSEYREFLPLSDDNCESELSSLLAALSRFPVPVVTAFENDANGLGWVLGFSGDANIYRADGHYSMSALWRYPALLQSTTALLDCILGERAAKAVLFDGEVVASTDLASYAGIVAAPGEGEVLTKALALAESLPLQSPTLFRQWRVQQTARRVYEATVSNAIVTAPANFVEQRPYVPFVSTSQCIETEAHDNGVLVVRMVDRRAKNMFSEEIIRGLEDVFAHIETSDRYRAVVLCGYDTYFACGGTKESLLAIQQGKAKFTDAKIYQLPMSCKLPVIAAMQGHAIGGGWALGMFADICIFSAESHYISPYMQYGFTPGAGSTLIFPATLGVDLARETLFTATEYTGAELQSKGLPHRCVTRAELMPRALELANALAMRNHENMVALKRYFSSRSLAALDDTYERELAMHEKSFVGQQHALLGVTQHFLIDGDSAAVSATVELSAPTSSVPVTASVSDAIVASTIAHELKVMLAAELQMNADDVDEDAQFIDLGLDSITGVTWVRRINSTYQTKIEATKVYSHPTLRQFCDFVYERLAASSENSSGKVAGNELRSVTTLEPTQVASRAAATPVYMPATETTTDTIADICSALKKMLALELHMAEADIEEDRQFVELGLDSITGVTWVRKINAMYGTKIEATKVYSHPTLIEFSRFLSASLPVQAIARRDPTPAAPDLFVIKPTMVDAPRAYAKQRPSMTSWRSQRTRHRASPGQNIDAIAVIGIAGQFPQAKNLDEFWRNIAGGKDCIGQVPLQRWNIDDYFNENISVSGTTNCRWMGILDDCDAFDPLFFNISPTEAESMDPQQRVTLQACWHAIENAAINPRALSGSRCGVFIGCGATDYHQRSREHRYSTQGFTGAAMSILAARISYFLNLQGPCLSIDTACSSSLVAIANACDSLASHDCTTALAGGVAVMAGPMMHVKTAQSGMLSPDGRCFAFDHRANGFVPGEGVGVLMLKRLADAERDGDIIHAIIRGWGVNQDGKTNGITAPNPVSQTRLMRGIYDKFAIDPEDIQLIEAHGTGTKLGDPIEVEGLNEAFRHYTQKANYCVLGSVKSNIGHCLYAAGVAGVLKLLLALKQRQLPPSANFERLNQHIDLTDSPFIINTALKHWPANAKGSRLGVVSSFGFSGTNAHLVLESSPQSASETTRDTASSQPVIIPLSAKTKEQLQQGAQDLADFIAKNETDLSLFDIAFTMQVGREAMEERCATVVRSKHELVERLRAFASGKASRLMHVGNTSSRASKLAFIDKDSDLRDILVEKCILDGKFEKLTELWVDGFDLTWDRLYQHQPSSDQRRRRIELPLYSFAKERYWLEDDMSSSAQFAVSALPTIHPMLHVNASTLRQQRYRTTFQGNEFFLRDHRVRLANSRVEHVLPGVAYLEMAAAAVADALPERSASQRLTLNNVAWWRPVIVNGPTAVSIELGVDDADAIVFEIVSESGGERVLHCQGEANFAEPVDVAEKLNANAALIASSLNSEGWNAVDIYAAFTQVGLHYGPTHRGIQKLCRSNAKVVARVALPLSANDAAAYRLHPGVMDSALQACIGFLPSLQQLPQEPSVPFTLQSLSIHAQCPPEVVVILTSTRGAMKSGSTDTCDVAIYAPDGRLCVELRGFSWRVVDTRKSLSTESFRPANALNRAPAFDEEFYQELLESISNNELSAEEAIELGLLS